MGHQFVSRAAPENVAALAETFMGEHLTMASEKEEMRHAGECVRLAGLTDDIAVRDQLVGLAEGWISTAHQDRRSAQVIALYPRQPASG
jgi:hypothetical protein